MKTGLCIISIKNAPIEKFPFNGIINEGNSTQILLEINKFMPEMHLTQHRFTYSACRPFIKAKERIKQLKKEDIQDLYIKTNHAKSFFSMV